MATPPWDDFIGAFAGLLRGQDLLEPARAIHGLERFFTFDNFERSAAYCARSLLDSGLTDVSIERFPADGLTSWSGWKVMKAWSVVDARLLMSAPRREVLCDWKAVPQSLVMYSGSTSTEAECVIWDGEEKDLAGKIPLTGRRINDVFPRMRALGVPGILSDFVGSLPGVREPSDIPDSCRWENAGLRPGMGAYWGFMLTPRQGAMLRSLLAEGPVRLEAEIDARCHDGTIRSVTGVIRGARRPQEEVLLVSHLYEPGANDNASGASCALAVARALQTAIASGAVRRPARSIRFLFAWEGYGLMAWMEKHAAELERMQGGIDIDEIGVDQAEGHSTMQVFLPPAANPSCVGPLALHLCQRILQPGFRWKAAADRAEILNDTLTSDPHIDIPMPCLIQYPARHYHVSSDVIGTLDPETMARIATVAASHLYILANPGKATGIRLAAIVQEHWEREIDGLDGEIFGGRWPFSRTRTEEFLTLQFSLSARSILRFGLPKEGAKALTAALRGGLESRSARWAVSPGETDGTDTEAARLAGLILDRGTLGSPKAWGSFDLDPAEEELYRAVLYGNDFDLIFHRICYWADGKRNLAETIRWMEIERFLLKRDTSISRTSSGAAIEGGGSVRIDVPALLSIVEALIDHGYLIRKTQAEGTESHPLHIGPRSGRVLRP